MKLYGHGSGDEQIRVIEAEGSERLEVLVDRYRRGDEEIVAISIEDADDDLDMKLLISERLNPEHHLHFHRHRHPIEVIVSYAGREDIRRSFRPNKRLEKVRAWAVGSAGFNFDPLDASELVLAFGDPAQRVNLDMQVGDLPHPGSALHLLLLPKSFFQG